MPVILTILQVLFVFFCKFTCKKRYIYIIPVIFLSMFSLIYEFNLVKSLLLFVSYLIMIDLSISDIVYREIDPKTYIPLSCLSIVYCVTYGNLISSVLSFLVSLVLMFIYFKLGNKFGEEMGGADIKLILILSLFYNFDDIFMFLIWTLIFTVVLSVFYSIKNKSIKSSTPMIVSITAGHLFISLIYLLGFSI